MNNGYIQNIFYHYILSDNSIASKISPGFFDSKNVQTCFKCAKEYVAKYHSAPSSDQLKEILSADGLLESIGGNDIVDILYSSESSVGNYSKEWLYDSVTTWAAWKNFINSIKDTAAYVKLNQDSVSVDNVKDILERAKGSFNRSCILEFDDNDDTGSDFWNAESHKQKKLKRSSSGYKFIDFCLNGGYFAGGLFVFVGAPKIGKSLWLQNLCAESVKCGEDNCYITLELPEEMVTSRIGSNMFSIPSLEYSSCANDVDKMAEKIQKFRRLCIVKPGNLVIKEFPTSTLSVPDLEAYLLSKEEELSTETKPFKFKNIFIDYINIMRNYRNPNSEDTYMKIKHIAEDLRAMGQKNGWVIITATQTNKTQYGLADIDPSQVSESSALGMTADGMWGIIATPIMMAQGKYYLKCLYDRVSPQANKKKLYNCDFNFLRITEDVSEGIIDVELQATIQQARKFSNNAAQESSNKPEFSSNLTQPQPTQYDVSSKDTVMKSGTSQVSTLISPITGVGMF